MPLFVRFTFEALALMVASVVATATEATTTASPSTSTTKTKPRFKSLPRGQSDERYFSPLQQRCWHDGRNFLKPTSTLFEIDNDDSDSDIENDNSNYPQRDSNQDSLPPLAKALTKSKCRTCTTPKLIPGNKFDKKQPKKDSTHDKVDDNNPRQMQQSHFPSSISNDTLLISPLLSSTTTKEQKYHAMLLFPHTSTIEFGTLTASLLMTGQFYRVTVIRIFFEQLDQTPAELQFVEDYKYDNNNNNNNNNKNNDYHHSDGTSHVGTTTANHTLPFRQKIISSIPCDHPIQSHIDVDNQRNDDLFQVVNIHVSLLEQNRLSRQPNECHGGSDHDGGTSRSVGSRKDTQIHPPTYRRPHHPFDWCMVQAAFWTVVELSRYQQEQQKEEKIEKRLRPDVIVTEASLLGGIWMSEIWQIPSVAIGKTQILPFLDTENELASTSSIRSSSQSVFENYETRDDDADVDYQDNENGGKDEEYESLWSKGQQLLQRRLLSLSITADYMDINRMRQLVFLNKKNPLMTTPSDVWSPLAAILMESSTASTTKAPLMASIDPTVKARKKQKLSSSYRGLSHSHSGGKLHILEPLQTPCVPCEMTPSSEKKSSDLSSSLMRNRVLSFRERKNSEESGSAATPKRPSGKKIEDILIIPPESASPVEIRNIVQGLQLARKSLQSYDPCHWDSRTCQKPEIHFTWFDFIPTTHRSTTSMPPISLQDLMRVNMTSVLDSVATTYSDAALMIMDCNQRETTMINDYLDMPVLCINENSNPFLFSFPDNLQARIIGRQILIHLRSRREVSPLPQQKESSCSRNDNDRPASVQSFGKGSAHATAIITKVAETHQEYSPWRNTYEMQQTTSHAVNELLNRTTYQTSSALPLSTSTVHESFLGFFAWTVVVGSSIYALFQKKILRKPYHRRRHLKRQYAESPQHNHHNEHFNFTSNNFFARPDLEDFFQIAMEWYRHQPQSFQELLESWNGRSWESNEDGEAHR